MTRLRLMLKMSLLSKKHVFFFSFLVFFVSFSSRYAAATESTCAWIHKYKYFYPYAVTLTDAHTHAHANTEKSTNTEKATNRGSHLERREPSTQATHKCKHTRSQ